MLGQTLCWDKKEKDFVCEPLPSNRDNLFFDNCRFGLVEAKNIIEQLNYSRENE